MADNVRDVQADLFALLAACPDTLVLWRAREAGEEVAVSPWFERLDALHQQAWGQGLDDSALRQWFDELAEARTPGPGTPVPAPRPRALPARLSVSAYNSLVACPYQYFARHVLKLNEEDEISAEVDKSDYGSLVHAILYRFHRRHPLLSEHSGRNPGCRPVGGNAPGLRRAHCPGLVQPGVAVALGSSHRTLYPVAEAARA